MNKQRNIAGINRLWLIQIGITLGMALLFGVFNNRNAAASAFLGGIIYILPNMYFAFKAFQYSGARAAKQIMNSFYKGEALKIVLSIALFAAVFKLCKITPFAFFLAYTIMLMTHWFAPWIIINKYNRLKK